MEYHGILWKMVECSVSGDPSIIMCLPQLTWRYLYQKFYIALVSGLYVSAQYLHVYKGLIVGPSLERKFANHLVYSGSVDCLWILLSSINDLTGLHLPPPSLFPRLIHVPIHRLKFINLYIPSILQSFQNSISNNPFVLVAILSV